MLEGARDVGMGVSRDMWGGGGVLEGARDMALCVCVGVGGTAKGTWIYAQGRFSLCLRGVCACNVFV